MSENREELLEHLEDIQYTTLWGVEVGKDGSLTGIELRHTTEFPSGAIAVDFSPSEIYLDDARNQIEKMKWDYLEDSDGKAQEQTVVCYLFASNPDKALCTNELTK